MLSQQNFGHVCQHLHPHVMRQLLVDVCVFMLCTSSASHLEPVRTSIDISCIGCPSPGLTSAMYMRNGERVPNPDPTAGLYIQNRHGDIVQAAIPATHLAFQIGQAMAIQSGGLLCATPHCVRGARGAAAAGVSRNTFAVFMQPEVTQQLEAPAGKRDAVLRSDSGQWRPGQSFGDFAEVTLKSYYSGAADDQQQQPRRAPMQVYVEHD